MSGCETCGQPAATWIGNHAWCMTCFELAMGVTSEEVDATIEAALAMPEPPDAGVES